MILNLARTRIMKKTRITITHQIEKTQHHFLVENPDKLSSSEVDRIKKIMGVEVVFVNGRLYKWKKGSYKN
jgi:midasin (ATPase involved in ribosome maturation)